MGGQRNVVVDVLVGHRQCTVTRVRRFAREHLVQHDAGGVHIAARIGGATFDLFGSEVGDRPEQDTVGHRRRTGSCDRPGQAEIGDLHHAIPGQQNVLRLDIPVDQPRPVRGRQPGQRGGKHGEGLLGTESTVLVDDRAQRLPTHEFHDQEDEAVVLALIADRNDIEVGKPCCRAGLAIETGDEGRVCGQRLSHHLDRNTAVQT